MESKLDGLGRALLDGQESRAVTPLALFIGLSTLVLGSLLAIGPYPITLFPTDSMHFLTQADYLVRGRRPYVDYYSLHGPFTFAFVAAGMKLEGVSLYAILVGQVLAAALFGLMILKVAVSRLHVAWAIVLATAVELLLASCTPIGRRSWREFSNAMWYNAISFSAMTIVFLYVLLPSKSKRPWSRWLDTAIAGFCLAASFLTKMSFAPPIVCVLAAGTILWPRGREMRIHGVAAFGFAIAFIEGFMGVLGGSAISYVEFLRSISLSVHPLALALRFVHHTRTISLLLVGAATAAWAAFDAGVLKRSQREWFLAFLMLGAWLATASTCKQDPEALPLIGILPLCLVVSAAALAKESGRTLATKLVVPSMLVALFIVTHDAKNSALSWPFSRVKIKTLEPPVERYSEAASEASQLIASKRVDPRLFDLMPKSWVESTFDALRLLKDSPAAPGDVLYVATIPNAITMFTDLEYTHGDSPWAPFSVAAKPTDVGLQVDDFLVDADWILRDLVVPDAWQHITHFRGKYVEENFEEISRNKKWALYGRRPGKEPAVPAESGSVVKE